MLRRWIDAGLLRPDEPAPPDPAPALGVSTTRSARSAERGAGGRIDQPDRCAVGRHSRAKRSHPQRERRQGSAATAALFGPDWVAADCALSCTRLSPTNHPTLTSAWSNSYWHGRNTASVGRGTGWTCGAMPIGPASPRKCDSQPHIWHWRDWIVESLNSDRGYDRMITDMLAGDELRPTIRKRCGPPAISRNWYRFNRNVWLDNTVEHMGKAFLGITLNSPAATIIAMIPFRSTTITACGLSSSLRGAC